MAGVHEFQLAGSQIHATKEQGYESLSTCTGIDPFIELVHQVGQGHAGLLCECTQACLEVAHQQ